MKEIPLARPDIGPKELQYVTDVLQTPFLSLGPKLPEFEAKVAQYASVKYAVAVNSGTSALHLIIKALEIGEGDEVITTPFSFFATAEAASMIGATPVFVDIDPATFNLDVSQVEAALTPRTNNTVSLRTGGTSTSFEQHHTVTEGASRLRGMFMLGTLDQIFGLFFLQHARIDAVVTRGQSKMGKIGQQPLPQLRM